MMPARANRIYDLPAKSCTSLILQSSFVVALRCSRRRPRRVAPDRMDRTGGGVDRWMAAI